MYEFLIAITQSIKRVYDKIPFCRTPKQKEGEIPLLFIETVNKHLELTYMLISRILG